MAHSLTIRAGVVAMLLACSDARATLHASDLVAAARARTLAHETYDGSYLSIPYPRGDVPADRGVCSDLVIRAYRALDVDLQQLVHEDMDRSFSAYPARWGLRAPDPNIDHRRVPNLQRFFERRGASLEVSANAADYRPGDLVTWNVAGRLPHIGVVSDRKVAGGARPQIIHNVGLGPVEEDFLFRYPITGHYRFDLER